MTERFSISDFASLITATSILFGVMLAYLVVMRILRQQRDAGLSLRSIADRNFYSKEEAWRASLERQIADLNERLTDKISEFREVNHLLIDAENASINDDQRNVKIVQSPFLSSLDISPQDVSDDLIFVLTPFEKREEPTFAAVVEAFQNWNIRVLRGDEEKVSSNILRHIVTLIAQARIVIANVATRNPNVMYELGIAQALGKTVILVSRAEEEVPFDLRNQRILLYKSRDDLISKLRESVGRVLFEKSG